MKKWFNKFVTTCVFTFALFLSSQMVSAAVNEAEPNDTNLTANEIAMNTEYIGSMKDKDDVDWYKFKLSENGYYNISLKLDALEEALSSVCDGWDVTLYSSDAKTEVIPTIKEVKTHAGVESMRLYLKKDAYYYITVSNHSSTLVGACVNKKYNLNVRTDSRSDWEAEANDDNLNANSIVTGVTYHGSSHKLKDVDWYKFTTSKKGYFNVRMCLNAGTKVDDVGEGWDYYVYRSGDLSTPIYQAKGIKTYNGDSSMNLGFEPGEFYIKVEKNVELKVSDAIYDIIVTETANDYFESESNDSSTLADVIGLNTEYQALLHDSKDVDWYRFTTTKKGYFNVSFTIPGNPVIENYGWAMSIYRVKDSSKAIWSEVQIKTNKETCNLPYEPGDYYIKIESSLLTSAPTATPYAIKVTQTASSGWELEPNDTEDTANTIKLNGSLNGYITNVTDKDFYKLVVPTNGNVTVALNKVQANANSGYGWTIQVFKNTSWSKAAMQFNVETDKGSGKAKLAAGTYFIVVKANNATSAPLNVEYKLKTSFAMTAVSGVEIQNLSATSVKITWTKETGVTGYDVYRSTSKNGTYKKVATVKTNSYTDKSLKCGSTFYYKIRKNAKIDGAAKSSPFSSIVSVKIKPAKPTLSSATNSSSKTMLVKWKVVSGISGYEIQYSLKNNFSANNKTISNISAKTAEKKITGLRAGKRYYVRLRTYKVVNGKKVYSDWSSVKNVGVK